MADIQWQCPHCNRFVVITENRQSSDTHFLRVPTGLGSISVSSRFFVCPNPDCKMPTCDVSINEWHLSQLNNPLNGKVIKRWRLLPEGVARPFPDYVPLAIRSDYKEACLIVNMSPKASATLSRRCLQGIVRDFWNVKAGTLWQEIQQIEDKTDNLTWQAIDAVRQIGNIGAHMEKDIDVIVDVDPGEAEMLIQLVETLLTEWYVARYEREVRMKALAAAAAAKKAPPPAPQAP